MFRVNISRLEKSGMARVFFIFLLLSSGDLNFCSGRSSKCYFCLVLSNSYGIVTANVERPRSLDPVSYFSRTRWIVYHDSIIDDNLEMPSFHHSLIY